MGFSLLKQAVPTHIISGFLGAGKTTVLQQLLQQKPEYETWAILMNEFGQIGIDQQLLPQQEGYAVKELLGGCLCCSSQLPMQIALSRLLAEQQPDRLFIEPTGLGHPAQLLEQLSEPHWQSSLDLRALVCVVDGTRLQDQAWINQELYQSQLKAAQRILISHTDLMTEADHQALQHLKQDYENALNQWILLELDALSLDKIDVPQVMVKRQLQPLLSKQQTLNSPAEAEPIKQLPYHYVEQAQGYSVAGWKFPQTWRFEFLGLLDLLCEQKEWQRIKAIFSTDQGWVYFNFTPNQFHYKHGETNIDQRIEIIMQGERDNWLEFEQQLLALRQLTN